MIWYSELKTQITRLLSDALSLHPTGEKQLFRMRPSSFPQQWQDDIMVWDPDKWGGIDIIGMSPDHIWTPDVILSNS